MNLFDNLLGKVEEANQLIREKKKTKGFIDNASEEKLHKAQTEGRDRKKYYIGNLNTWKNSNSSKPSLQVMESLNRMRKYINTYSMVMNVLFRKLNMSPVSNRYVSCWFCSSPAVLCFVLNIKFGTHIYHQIFLDGHWQYIVIQYSFLASDSSCSIV